MAEKPHINMVFVGHVDNGKSTLVGRLLYELGEVSEQAMKKLRDEAAKIGKATFEYAWVMDTLKEERTRGVTIDIAHKKFQTDKNYFTIIDAPGHRDFIKNMITGASQADVSVLVVSVYDTVNNKDEKGNIQLLPQTKEHAFLCKTLGVNQYIIAMNKMDAVKYDAEAYNAVKDALVKFLKPIGYKVDTIPFIPLSAFVGDNLKTKSTNMPWYNGLTFLECLNNLVAPPKPIDKPLRLPIQDAYSITGIGTVPVGRIESGILKPGMKIVFMPSAIVDEVKTIEMHHEQIPEGLPGDNVGFNIRSSKKEDIVKGNVIGTLGSPPKVAEEFTAQIVVLYHPSAIAAGYSPVLHIHTDQVACKFEELIKTVDPRTGQTKEDHPKTIKAGDVAVVRLKPMRSTVVEIVKDFPPLGRFAIRDMGQTIAAGMVLEVKAKEVKIKA
ncbi:MAG: translation elongation factor EF-1 subunit alpha [Candidatus Altarchaeum sp. CG12_big_fil_rev_8_21_14_0_65_33_22]|nr:translation elongation factor EF-1 subunit alpha [Candidatus Altarchaeum hamiconexum]OIQ04940.1 MAG: translation elongation factor EF-1 subunit alpha [Candidatus Altarchaeum sp. CG2_30_32_3053]PIN67102.1 MAG: translation elongation factor EF-1 subunit alpha [Candidatus Altarchaeum sp. CG12_big_fil_rev_8_21_14_0_65_33_22]PJC14734.1 MAG: translation elongation factor EF-1 subunit alpha [Candidatus Altarchaeum sp. CG_4_9_14_0_8_um_filter_32_206]